MAINSNGTRGLPGTVWSDYSTPELRDIIPSLRSETLINLIQSEIDRREQTDADV